MRRNGFIAIAIFISAKILFADSVRSEEIRVRINKLSYEFQVKGRNLRVLKKDDIFRRASLGAMQAMKIRFEPEKRLWAITDEKVGVTRYREIRGEVLALEADELYLENTRVPKRLLLFGEPQYERVDAVASLDLELYLRGVLPSEMPASWPVEALKAQAVASRSYALFKKAQQPKARFHVVASIMDQVFNYQNLQELSPGLQDKVTRVLLETHGLVLESPAGKTMQAFYHSACGGRTEPAKRIWEGAEETPSVADPHCRGGRYSKWKRKVSFHEIGKKLKVNSQVKSVQVLSHTESGRVGEIELKLKSGKRLSVSANQLRKELGYSRIKSTFFSVHSRNGHLQFKGRGYGHGAGLCQWGARGMSLQGKSFTQILAHYYPMAKLRRGGARSVVSL